MGERLKARMLLAGKAPAVLAREMGKSLPYLYGRLAGRQEFSHSEIQTLALLLGLTTERAFLETFFPDFALWTQEQIERKEVQEMPTDWTTKPEETIHFEAVLEEDEGLFCPICGMTLGWTDEVLRRGREVVGCGYCLRSQEAEDWGRELREEARWRV